MAVDGLGELTAVAGRLQHNLDPARLNRDAGHRIGRVGNDEVRAEYTKLFGSDHKFSGAAKSQKAKRKATVRYRVGREDVEILPSGDPIYIFMKGRGRSNIRPVKRKALSTPHGPRAGAHGGRMAPRPAALDPAVKRIADRAAVEVSKAVDSAIIRALR